MGARAALARAATLRRPSGGGSRDSAWPMQSPVFTAGSKWRAVTTLARRSAGRGTRAAKLPSAIMPSPRARGKAIDEIPDEKCACRASRPKCSEGAVSAWRQRYTASQGCGRGAVEVQAFCVKVPAVYVKASWAHWLPGLNLHRGNAAGGVAKGARTGVGVGGAASDPLLHCCCMNENTSAFEATVWS